MAATESALTIHNDISMELPELAPNQGLEAFKDILFGSAAGMIGKVIEYPFDTVKVRLQSQPDHLPLRYNGPLDCFRQSFQAEGLRGLYRGISAPMAGAAVENSCLFFSYRVVQELLQASYYSSTEPLPLTALVFSGAASGSITSLALTPIELIKCKMQVPSEPSSARVGPLKIIVSVFRQDGVLGFWRGQLGTLIRETGGGAAWFGGYEGVSALFRSYHYSPSTTFSSEVESGSLPLYQQMLAGAAAGVSYNFLFYPADTIKSRLQTEDINNTSSKRQTFGGAARLSGMSKDFAAYIEAVVSLVRGLPQARHSFLHYLKAYGVTLDERIRYVIRFDFDSRRFFGPFLLIDDTYDLSRLRFSCLIIRLFNQLALGPRSKVRWRKET
uniref:Mitochondrial transport protein n=1 Tax=Emericella nidulans TaxID=162425 RepID=Q92228_EMEND|nr:mitochondrial transport protein amc-1 [Aspergillus nidulans]AAD44763.1 mitochondrial transport protein [Aspergillus nidulans]